MLTLSHINEVLKKVTFELKIYFELIFIYAVRLTFLYVPLSSFVYSINILHVSYVEPPGVIIFGFNHQCHLENSGGEGKPIVFTYIFAYRVLLMFCFLLLSFPFCFENFL